MRRSPNATTLVPFGLCEVGNKSVNILMRDFTAHFKKLLFRHCAHLKFRTEQSFLWLNAKAELWQQLVFNVQCELKQQDAD